MKSKYCCLLLQLTYRFYGKLTIFNFVCIVKQVAVEQKGMRRWNV